mmetsp:Transcript_4126/g.6547  ORF Transcript_4126/g.6547 Transcript_4126/m.6547 type:complete len:88 (+) Transcript_4126:66-329(+)
MQNLETWVYMMSVGIRRWWLCRSWIRELRILQLNLGMVFMVAVCWYSEIGEWARSGGLMAYESWVDLLVSYLCLGCGPVCEANARDA